MLSSNILHSATPVVVPIAESTSLSPYLSWMVDPTSKLNIQQISNPSSSAEWQISHPDRVLNFGLTDATSWVRWSMHNSKSDSYTYLLELSYPLNDIVELYSTRFSDPPKLLGRSGDHLPFDKWEINYRNPTFPITIGPNEDLVLYMKVKTSSSMQIPLMLYKENDYFANRDLVNLSFGIYLGSMLIMIAFNLILFIFLKDFLFIYYVAYIASFFLAQFTLNGLGFVYFWPKSPHITNIILPFSVCMGSLFLLQFSSELLSTRIYIPQLFKFVRVMKAIALISALLSLLLPYKYTVILALINTILLVPVLALCAIPRLKVRDRAAQIYIISFGALFFAIIATSLRQIGVLPNHWLINISLPLFSALEIMLLSLALGDRIRTKQIETYKKLENITQLLRLTIHDIANPLTICSGTNEIVKGILQKGRGARLDEKQIEALLNFNNKSGKAIDLIQDLLGFVRNIHAIESGKLQLNICPVSIQKAIDNARFVFGETLAKKKINLIFDNPLEDCLVLADPVSLTNSVLNNFISNAIKFSKEGGDITIRTSLEHSMVQVAIIDNGVGMPQAQLDKIFDSNVSTTHKGTSGEEGTGFGMPIAHSLMQQYNGYIEVESRCIEEYPQNHGTTFKLFFVAADLLPVSDRST